MRYVKISVIAKPTIPPPYFIGSQVRGTLGHVLKKVVCINPSFKCNECFAKDNCIYYDFYEAKNKTHQYRLNISLGEKYYDFDIYLFEDACSKTPYIVSTLYKLLTEHEIGKNGRVFTSFDIFVNDKNIIKDSNIKISENFIKTFEIKKTFKDIKLSFETPLRIKKNNVFVRDGNIELKDIVNSIYQRQIRLLKRKHKRFPYEISAKTVSKYIYYKELTRRSNRQNRTMNIGGIMGEIVYENIDEKSYNVLKLGELIGVGKQTVFGLGKINIEELL